jgi:16S rRNA (adenine1518-N6/adenine1519-N6)-dimethyltransferase
VDERFAKYKPKKFLGQNFLTDVNIAKKIVSAFELSKDDTILEIGPGYGSLSKHIAGNSGKYYAVEIDTKCILSLKATLGNQIEIFEKDFLEFDFEKDLSSSKKIKIAGNIPYHITTAILFKLFEYGEKLDFAVLMMQKEVAQRLVAKPNTKEYGILSVQTNYYTKPEMLFTVSPGAFFPKPRVNSAVVKFKFEKREPVENENLFKLVVRESFGKRRKTLRNSLKKLFENYNIEPEKINFDFSRRPESLSLQEFIFLCNEIAKQGVDVV